MWWHPRRERQSLLHLPFLLPKLRFKVRRCLISDCVFDCSHRGLLLSVTDFSKTISYIIRGVELNQPRLLQRAIRQNANIRKYIGKELLMETISKFVPIMCPTFEAMAQAASLIPSSGQAAPAQAAVTLDPPSTILPEVEVFIYNTIVTTLLREQLNTEAAVTATALVERIRSFNRRSLDLMSSKAFGYFSLAYEKLDKLEDIRPVLLTLYRTASIRHDEMGQSVLLNLVLRNYLHYNLIEQAQTLSVRTTFPEGASNNQFCRYLYYMGRIQAIQLEYSSSYQRLMMAARKAPQDVGAGFVVMVQKLCVIVQLLMGDIPERSLFNQAELRVPLRPYLALTQAVRNGDLQIFNSVVEKYAECFKADKNYSLILRLGHNVIKTGLRKISISYSRISLADVAAKLHLPNVASAEYICAKSIRYESFSFSSGSSVFDVECCAGTESSKPPSIMPTAGC
jgi:26S proteasome regulatory subunit N3